MDAVEVALASFRTELERESVATTSIDELVEHLREIIDARIAAGDDVASAIQTARDRLGEPKALARECGRVRSTFGPKPSRTVAWLVVGLVATWFALWISLSSDIATTGIFRIGVVVVIALALRSPQAIAFMLGYAISTVLFDVRLFANIVDRGEWSEMDRTYLLLTIVALAIVVLIVSSTRLTRAALAMVALGWALGVVGGFKWLEWDLDGVQSWELFGRLAIGAAIAMTALRLPGTWLVCLACAALGLPWLQYLWGHHPNGQRYTDVYEAIRIVTGSVIAPIVAARSMWGQSRSLADLLRSRNGPTATA